MIAPQTLGFDPFFRPKETIQSVSGRVTQERRRALGRKINEVLRLLL